MADVLPGGYPAKVTKENSAAGVPKTAGIPIAQGSDEESERLLQMEESLHEQIKLLARLQLEKVKETARAQGIELSFADSLVDHVANIGFAPEAGARELEHRIQTEVETKLAKALLSGEISEGATVRLSYDPDYGVLLEEVPGQETKSPQSMQKGKRGQRKRTRDERRERA